MGDLCRPTGIAASIKTKRPLRRSGRQQLLVETEEALPPPSTLMAGRSGCPLRRQVVAISLKTTPVLDRRQARPSKLTTTAAVATTLVPSAVGQVGPRRAAAVPVHGVVMLVRPVTQPTRPPDLNVGHPRCSSFPTCQVRGSAQRPLARLTPTERQAVGVAAVIASVVIALAGPLSGAKKTRSAFSTSSPIKTSRQSPIDSHPVLL